MRVDLDGRVAFVTGAGRNIGRAIALRLAESGVAVACAYHSDPDAAAAVAEEIQRDAGRAKAYEVDLQDVESIKRVLGKVAADFEHVDILVNNAAMRPRTAIGDVTVDEWNMVHNINLRGPFFLSQAIIPSMRSKQWGRIINISGIDAYWGNPQRPHVVASKLGIVGLGRSLANETARWGITVNTVVPGAIDTVRPHPEWYPDQEDRYQERRERTPQARIGVPDDIAHMCLYLASNEANYITGQELLVTGGAHPLVRQPSKEY